MPLVGESKCQDVVIVIVILYSYCFIIRRSGAHAFFRTVTLQFRNQMLNTLSSILLNRASLLCFCCCFVVVYVFFPPLAVFFVCNPEIP